MFNKDGLVDIYSDEHGDDWPMAMIPSSETYLNSHPNPNKSKSRTYSGQWYPSDTEELYDRNITGGIKIDYKKDDFYYDINSVGFRCDDFDTMDFTKKSIIYLGCSHTFGIGLPEEHCWPTIIHNKIQEEHNTTYNYINLGVPGGGFDWYLHFLPYFSKFNPTLIISANPEVTRMNLISESGALCQFSPVSDAGRPSGSRTENSHDKRIGTTYKRMLLEEKHFEYRKEVILANVDAVAKILHSKFITMDGRTVLNADGIIDFEPGLARDNMHFGKVHHTVLAEILMKKIKENK